MLKSLYIPSFHKPRIERVASICQATDNFNYIKDHTKINHAMQIIIPWEEAMLILIYLEYSLPIQRYFPNFVSLPFLSIVSASMRFKF